MEPDGELGDPVFVVEFRDQQPRFESRNVDLSVRGGGGAPAAVAAARQPATRAAAEQENLFWQSIVNRANTAELEAYLAQFPDGEF